MEKIKALILKIKRFTILQRYTIYLTFPFLAMDLITRMHGYKVTFFPWYYPVPNLFTILWILLMIGIVTSLKGVAGKIAYWVFFIISFALFMTHNIYYSLTGFYFGFNLLKMSDEGSSYIWDTIIHTNPLFYLICVAILVLAIVVAKKKPMRRKFNGKRLIIIVLVFLVGHLLLPLFLGPANASLEWNTFKNPRNIYNDYNDCNKSMKVSGMYEYSVRNFYVTFLKPKEKISKEDKAFLDRMYTAEDMKVSNAYTGMFEGKNLIFLQLEGMDSWMLTKETTPNLYALKNQSIDFKEHYSMYTGGGSTFNSEFAVNTGFTTPLSYIENVYSFNTNTFENTMAKLFKEQKNYTVNAFHMNSKDFYSRGVNYDSWGYDHYYGLKDIKTYDDLSYELDRELILNETFYEKMFKQQGNFVDYIITYSPHTPFTTEKKVGKLLAEEKYGDNIPELSEEDCAKLAAGETDYMVGLLIQALKDNELYENTVIVAYADHYLYTIEDKSVLDKYKTTENNLINHTPLFIWSSDTEHKSIKSVTMQTNILPTVLNLFGIDYNSNWFISKDALAEDYEGFAFFPDYSWYDGNVYVENDKITNGGKMGKKKLNQMNEEIGNIIRQNDLTLKYDYFKK